MFIIYGRRSYGRVDACGTEFAKTKFVHVYFMPLIPTESVWFTSENTGFTSRLNLKSVAATYIRWWSIPAIIGVLSASPLFAGLPIAGALIALYAWSWTWASVRSAHEQRKRDFNRLAFGTRCEPAQMDDLMRMQVSSALKDRWSKIDAGRSPDDVARFGAKNSGEAVVAYGLLRLAALERNSKAEAEAADRILAGTHDALPTDQGPYRDAAQEPAAETPSTGQIHAQVAAAATRFDANRGRPASYAPAKKNRAPALGVLAGIVALGCIGGVIANYGGLVSKRDVTVAELHTYYPSTDRYVTIQCEQVDLYGQFTDYSGSKTLNDVYNCTQGNQSVAIVADPGEPVPNTVEGKVKSMSGELEWSDYRMQVPNGGSYYIETGSQRNALYAALGCLAGVVVSIAGGVLLIRRARRGGL